MKARILEHLLKNTDHLRLCHVPPNRDAIGYPDLALRCLQHLLFEREFSAPIKDLVTSLVADALGVKAEDERARLHALLVLSQLSILQEGADTTLNALGWPDFAGDRAALVKKTFRDHVGRLLASPLPVTTRSPPRGGR